MRSKNLIFGLTASALAVSALALSHPVQAHERAYSAPSVIVVGGGHHEGHGGYCRPRSRHHGRPHHGYRRHHDHHEYYRHHREYSHGRYRYRDQDHGTIRFRIDYREIL